MVSAARLIGSLRQLHHMHTLKRRPDSRVDLRNQHTPAESAPGTRYTVNTAPNRLSKSREWNLRVPAVATDRVQLGNGIEDSLHPIHSRKLSGLSAASD